MMAIQRNLSLPLIEHKLTAVIPSFFAGEAKCFSIARGNLQQVLYECSNTAPRPHDTTTNVHSHILLEGEGVSTVAWTRLRLVSGLWGSLWGGLDWSPEPVATAAPGLSWQNRLHWPYRSANTWTPTQQGRLNYTELHGCVVLHSKQHTKWNFLWKKSLWVNLDQLY